MKKEGYIEKYGLEAYEAFKNRQREYAKSHKQHGDRHSEGYYRERYRRLKDEQRKKSES